MENVKDEGVIGHGIRRRIAFDAYYSGYKHGFEWAISLLDRGLNVDDARRLLRAKVISGSFPR